MTTVANGKHPSPHVAMSPFHACNKALEGSAEDALGDQFYIVTEQGILRNSFLLTESDTVYYYPYAWNDMVLTNLLSFYDIIFLALESTAHPRSAARIAPIGGLSVPPQGGWIINPGELAFGNDWPQT